MRCWKCSKLWNGFTQSVIWNKNDVFISHFYTRSGGLVSTRPPGPRETWEMWAFLSWEGVLSLSRDGTWFASFKRALQDWRNWDSGAEMNQESHLSLLVLPSIFSVCLMSFSIDWLQTALWLHINYFSTSQFLLVLAAYLLLSFHSVLEW